MFYGLNSTKKKGPQLNKRNPKANRRTKAMLPLFSPHYHYHQRAPPSPIITIKERNQMKYEAKQAITSIQIHKLPRESHKA